MELGLPVLRICDLVKMDDQSLQIGKRQLTAESADGEHVVTDSLPHLVWLMSINIRIEEFSDLQ